MPEEDTFYGRFYQGLRVQFIHKAVSRRSDLTARNRGKVVAIDKRFTYRTKNLDSSCTPAVLTSKPSDFSPHVVARRATGLLPSNKYTRTVQGVGFEPTKGKARLIYSQVHLTALAPLHGCREPLGVFYKTRAAETV